MRKIHLPRVLLVILLLTTSAKAMAYEVIDVSLTKNKITARQTTVNNKDFLNICSRDNELHQPYSLSDGNKFGSSLPRSKDILNKEHCRIQKVKNNGSSQIEMMIQDRYYPENRLTLKINPKNSGSNTAATEPSNNFYADPKYKGQRLDYCYTPQKDCGEKVANEWCQTQGFKSAKTYEPATTSNFKIQTRYLGNNQTCRKQGCQTFRSITCQKAPPTFF